MKTRVKMGVGLLLVALIVCVWTVQVEAAESETGPDPTQLDFTPVDDVLRESGADKLLREQTGSETVGDLVASMLQGEGVADWSQWGRAFGKLIVGNLGDYMALVLQVAALAVLSRFFSSLELHFGDGAAGSIGFLCVYGVLVLVLMKSFQIAYQEVNETLRSMQRLSLYMMPAMAAVAVAGGFALSSTIQSELMTGGFSLLLTAMRQLLTHAILWVTVLEVVNFISKRAVLTQLTSLVRTLVEKGVKAAGGLYLLLMGACSLVVPAADRTLYKASSALVSAVPVVGSGLSGAMESVMAGSLLIKNGIGAAGCLILLCICLLPVARLATIWLVYRLLAAFLAPVVDSRVTQLLEALGRSAAALLGLLVCGVVVFTGAVGIFVATTGH